MAKKFVDNKGKTPLMVTAISEARKRILMQEQWFVEHKNANTGTALAQKLGLVDDPGDQIFYNGKALNGFRVSFDTVLFLVESRNNGVYDFAVYHRDRAEKNWTEWQEYKKPPKSVVTAHRKSGVIKNAMM
jgi:hypothetical protein